MGWGSGEGGVVYGKLLPWDCHHESMIIFVGDLAAVHIIKISIIIIKISAMLSLQLYVE